MYNVNITLTFRGTPIYLAVYSRIRDMTGVAILCVAALLEWMALENCISTMIASSVPTPAIRLYNYMMYFV